MPNRIFREGFVDSDAVAGLSDWSHRCYSLLLVKVDDAGRQDGRLEAIRSCLFPLAISRRSEDVQVALEEIQARKLAILYEFNGKKFIQVTKWQKCGAAITSKFPWKDGSFIIPFVSIQTRDGVKEFVATSILDEGQFNIPSPPHADRVATDLNTKTKTNYEDVRRRRTNEDEDEDERAKTNGELRSTKTFRSSLLSDDLSSLCFEVLGKDEMAKHGSRWRKRMEDNAGKLERVLNETRNARNEGRIKTTNPKFAEDAWKRFK